MNTFKTPMRQYGGISEQYIARLGAVALVAVQSQRSQQLWMIERTAQVLIKEPRGSRHTGELSKIAWLVWSYLIIPTLFQRVLKTGRSQYGGVKVF
jgi:hypothetical protein